ncbi:hypothetical protein J5491_03000 [Candidatus Saccharibacteria bacterium]|nr:hypothetical protein [Candidatus Saccharibacteria bacterium]
MMCQFIRKYNAKISIRLAIILPLFLFATMVFVDGRAFADPNGAEGNGSYNVTYPTNCDAPHAYSVICQHSNGFYYGGAAWRVFDLDSLNVSKPSGGGLDITAGNLLPDRAKRATAINECKAADAQYMASFGWEGITPTEGSGNGWYNYQIGPAARLDLYNGGYQDIKYAAYNKYKNINNEVAKKWSEIRGGLKGGNLGNNIRITNGAAVAMYRRYLYNTQKDVYPTLESTEDITEIPDTTAYFCFKKSYVTKDGDSSFLGKASVSQGAWDNNNNNQNRDSTGFINKSESVTLEMPSGDSGTTAYFYLRIKRESGSEKAKYHYRSGNNVTSDGKFAWSSGWPDWTIEGHKNLSDSNGYLINSPNSHHTVLPGQKYCYDLNFRSGGEDDNDKKHTVKSRGCAKALVTYFYGYSTISSDTPATKLYTNKTGTDGWTMVPCTIAGCKIRFRHWMRTNNNYGSTTYSINRNYSNFHTKDVGNISKISTGSLKANQKLVGPKVGGTRVYESGELTLYPGMKVCENLIFTNSNHFLESERSSITKQVCAYGKGSANTTLDISVKNTKVNNYNKDGLKAVYAKPGDEVAFDVSYDPALQYAYYMDPPYLRINHAPGQPNEPIGGGGKTLGTVFDNNAASYKVNKWGNGFSVFGENFTYNVGYSFDSGDITKRDKEADNKQTISEASVGLELKEHAETNVAGSSKTTPSQIDFFSDTFNGSGHFINDVITTPVKSEASVKVPYNFKTSISVELDGAKQIKFDGKTRPAFASGESGGVKIHVDLLKKHNDLTTNSANEEYATKSDDAKFKVVLFVPPDGSMNMDGTLNYGSLDTALCNRYSGSSVCSEAYVEKLENGKATPRTLKSIGLNGGPTNESSSIVVPDLDAGTRVCVAAAVYPSTSGADDNLSPEGSKTWNVSDAKCFAVYKKPSLQVWGGNVFSAGKIDTPVAVKKHVFNNNGYDDYNVLNKGAGRIFGSFGEISVISLGSVSGFSSGAATGYAGYNERDHVMIPRQSFPANMLNVLINQKLPVESFGGYVGGSDSGFCERSRLTFANTGCNNGVTTGLGGSGQSSASANRSSLIATFVNMNDEERTRKNVTVETPDDDYTISEEILLAKGNGEEETPGETKVIYAKKDDVTIDTNILYDDSGYYKLSDVPKLVIYAKNIWINCGVTRIDAVLIAEETVDTCADLDGDSMGRKSSNQLVVNGTIIANKLEARRTYGAAASGNSIVPAEIVNYDTTLYLWGSNQADVTETGKLDVTYSREIAPKR